MWFLIHEKSFMHPSGGSGQVGYHKCPRAKWKIYVSIYWIRVRAWHSLLDHLQGYLAGIGRGMSEGFDGCGLKIYEIEIRNTNSILEELDGPVISALWRAIAEVKQRLSVIGWVTKNLLSRAPPCFRRHVNPLVPAAFAVVSTHQPALGPRGGLWPVLIMCNP
jgi:hypothetical protein